MFKSVLACGLYFSTVLSQKCKDTPVHPSGSFNVTIDVAGVERVFQLFTPWNEYDCGGAQSYCVGPPQQPRPLVINWHGCNAHIPVVAYQEQVSKVEQSASDFLYYAITPVGSRAPFNDYGWNTYGIDCGKVGTDDFEFAQALLDYAEENLCVDMSRVYSTGFSTGGFHTNALGCSMTNKFAGIAPVAGSIGRRYFAECSEGPPISVLSFHSKDDGTVPYDGNADWVSQPDVTAMWESRNGCTNETASVTFQSDTTLCRRWECSGAAIEDCTLTGLDHCWVGGRSGGFQTMGSCVKRPGDIDATVHMFETWERESMAKNSQRPASV